MVVKPWRYRYDSLDGITFIQESGKFLDQRQVYNSSRSGAVRLATTEINTERLMYYTGFFVTLFHFIIGEVPLASVPKLVKGPVC